MQATRRTQPRNFLIFCFAFVFYYLGEGHEWVITFLCYVTEGDEFVPPDCVSDESQPVAGGPACPACWLSLAVGDSDDALQ